MFWGDNSETQESYRLPSDRRSDYYGDYYELPVASRSGHGYGDCCPLVVDPLTLFAILLGIAGATFFLNTAITMNIMRRKRRKRAENGQNWAFDLLQSGKQF